MDYGRIYENLIERARTRTLDGYSERHHITPKCLGGSDSAGNLVRLTPEEHFFAHRVLAKMFPRHRGINLALIYMSYGIRGKRTPRKLHGWMRRRVCVAIREMKTGVPRPQWVIEKMRIGKTGTKDSAEGKANKSASAKRVTHTDEWNANVAKSKIGSRGTRLGVKLSPETKEKMRQAALGRKHTAETIAKLEDFAAKQTQEQRSARAHKAWETKRANAA